MKSWILDWFGGSAGRGTVRGQERTRASTMRVASLAVLALCTTSACGQAPGTDEGPSVSSIREAIDPSDFSPIAWYEATSSTVVVLGAGVSEWEDSSGNGFDLTQTVSGNRPSYSATGWDGSEPAVTFDGSDDFLEYPSSSGALLSELAGSDQPFTVFMTWEPLDLDQDYDLMQWDNGGANGGNSLVELRTNAAGDDEARYRHRRGDGTTSVTNTGTPKFTLDRRTTGFVFSGTALTIYDDDDVHLSAGANDVGALTLVRYRLGHGDNAALSGRIAEVVIVGSALSQSDYEDYRTYAASRWEGCLDTRQRRVVSR